MPVNRFQEALIANYRDAELLLCVSTRPDDVDRMVRGEGTGDGLFDFLWKEISDFPNDADPEEVAERVRQARRDLDAVEAAFDEMEMASAAEAPSP
mgnify:FL=1